jgi:hypothetical protein
VGCFVKPFFYPINKKSEFVGRLALTAEFLK